MKLNRFAQRDKPSPIHSSGFVQRPGQIGSTSVDSFSQRMQRDSSRQVIRGYRDAQVLRQSKAENYDNLSTSRLDTRQTPRDDSSFDTPRTSQQPQRSSRIDIVKPTGRSGPNSTPLRAEPQEYTFREPPSRRHP